MRFEILLAYCDVEVQSVDLEKEANSLFLNIYNLSIDSYCIHLGLKLADQICYCFFDTWIDCFFIHVSSFRNHVVIISIWKSNPDSEQKSN